MPLGLCVKDICALGALCVCVCVCALEGLCMRYVCP